MYKAQWQQRLKEAVAVPLKARTLAAFNTNIDAVVHVDAGVFERILSANSTLTPERVRAYPVDPAVPVADPGHWVAVMRECLRQGKSLQVASENGELFSWLEAQFAGAASERMGGQAGIIANQMASLGASSTVYATMLSPTQARLFMEDVTVPVVENGSFSLRPVRSAGRPEDPTKINWIFEYAKGERIQFWDEEIVTPRANRLIVSSQALRVNGFASDIIPWLPELGRYIDVAFVAGYHHVAERMPDGRSFQAYVDDSVEHLRLLRRDHRELRFHFEYVTMRNQALEPATLKAICSEVGSFGINENEIKRVLRLFGFQHEYEALLAQESAHTLYRAGLALLRELGVERVHIHNLGYYVLVLRKPYPVQVEQAVQACLYASGVNAMKAKYGGYVVPKQMEEAGELPLSEIGLAQVERFAQTAPSNLTPVSIGVWEAADHYVAVMPAHVVPNPVSTVGMGDTISSSAFSMEVQLGLGSPTAKSAEGQACSITGVER